jgi:predicted XRE-type DNA-binding protein
MKKENDDSVVSGSGNVFADLKLPKPDERSVRAKLASKIYDRIEASGWTQTQAAHELGISQPDVSRLTRGILNDFSIDRLMLLLGRLNYRVSIRLQSENEQSDEILVSA